MVSPGEMSTPSPDPLAVEKATNPIALRYWNQCTEQPATSPSPQPEVVKVLSTAGTGITRKNQLREACGNISRFITVDKVYLF